MADCCLCGLSVVTTNFVKVPSQTLAWEETGRWVGLCDSCLKACVRADDSERTEHKGVCDICGIKDIPLYGVKYTETSLEKPVKVKARVCKKCLKACRYTSTQPYDDNAGSLKAKSH